MEGMWRCVEYHVLDVFADAALQGNPLTVVPDASGLDTATMQAIASETNHSETTFIEGQDPDGAWRVRIFTPKAEIPFAGHPTLGTAWLIRHLHGDADVTLRLGVGDIQVTADGDTLWMTQRAPRFGETMQPDRMATILGLAPGDVLGAQLVDTGIPFWVAHLPDVGVLGRCRLDHPALVAAAGPEGCDEVLIFAVTDTGVQCRMFAPGLGVPEDPATGSANGCLAAYLWKHQILGDGAVDVESRQGIEMGRPSRLFLRAEEGLVQVGGRVVPVAKGQFLLPHHA